MARRRLSPDAYRELLAILDRLGAEGALGAAEIGRLTERAVEIIRATK